MPYEFMKDPAWNDLDDKMKVDVIGQAFRDDIVSDPEWQSIPDDTKTALKDFYFQEADQYSKSLEPPVERTALETAGDVLVSGAKSIVGFGETAVGLTDLLTMGRSGKALEKYAGYDPKMTHDFLSNMYSSAQKLANRKVEGAEGFFNTVKEMAKNPSTIGHAVVETAPQIMGGVAAAKSLLSAGAKAAPLVAPLLAGTISKGTLAAGAKVAPLIAGAAGEGILAAGSSAEQIRQQTETGTITPKQALFAATAGAGTSVFSLAGGSLARKLGFGDIDTMFVKTGLDTTEAGVAKRIVGGGITEGIFEELPQSAQEQIWQNAALDRPLLDGVPEASATGLVTGFAIGSGANIAKAKTPDEAIDSFEKSVNMSIESKQYEDFLAEQIVEKPLTGPEQVQAQADVFDPFAEPAAPAAMPEPEKFISDVEAAEREAQYRKEVLPEAKPYVAPVDVRKQELEAGGIQARKVGAEVPAVVEKKPLPQFETKPLEKALAEPMPEKKEPPKLIEQKKDFILGKYEKPTESRVVNQHKQINKDMNVEDFREMRSADLIRQKEQYSFEKNKTLAKVIDSELSQRFDRKKVAEQVKKEAAAEKRKGATTFGGWIKETGGLNPANQRSDLLSRDKTGARLFKKDGRELEKAQDEAVKEGWILPSEDLADIITNDPERLRSGKLDEKAKTKYQKEQAAKLEEAPTEMPPDYDVEGAYKQVLAGDLETGTKSEMVIDGKYDTYEVVQSVPFGDIELKDSKGEPVMLDTGKQIEVREKKVPAKVVAPAAKVVEEKPVIAEKVEAKKPEEKVYTDAPVPEGSVETGKPIKYHYYRNKEKTPDMGKEFAQDIEPSGKYIAAHSGSKKHRMEGYEYGVADFKNPLILEHKTTRHGGWKTDLQNMYDGKTGKDLTEALKKDGYDGIITVDKGRISESVMLVKRPSKEKSEQKQVVVSKEEEKKVDRQIKDEAVVAPKAKEEKPPSKKLPKGEPELYAVKKKPIANIDTPAFKKWSGGNEVLEEYEIADAEPNKGYVFRVYHGTTNKFNVFDPTLKGNKEGQFGAVNYFTSDIGDADMNYAGEGPDLTNRIELRKEQIEYELEDITEEEATNLAEQYGLEFDPETETYPEELPMAMAREELSGGEKIVLDVYVKSDNPAFIGGETETWIENFEEIDQSELDDAWEEIKERNDAEESEREDYQYEIEDLAREERYDEESKISEAIADAVRETGNDPGDVYAGLGEILYESEVSATDLEKALRENESFSYMEDYETGELVQSNIIGQVFKNLGFDSIVLQNANNRFKTMDMSSETSHVHVFEETPSNIKSIYNVGTFDPTKADIFYKVDKKPISSGLSLPEIKSIFPGQEVGVSKDGSVWVQTTGGNGLVIKNVNQITPDKYALQMGYGSLKAGELIAGKYKDGTIEISAIGDKFVLAHESFHFIEDIGLLTEKETKILNNLTGNLKGVKGKEARARFIENALKNRDKYRGKPFGKILQKISDFIDSLANFIRSTPGGIIREIESGRIYGRTAEAMAEKSGLNSVTAARWYSQMEKVLEDKLPGKGSPKQFKSTIQSWSKKGLIKKEELEWSGVEDFLDSQTGKVSKQEVLDYLRNNRVSVEEILKDDVESATKFAGYQLPGWEKYKELLLTLPSEIGQGYKSIHWNEPNILAHVRFSERNIGNARVLHIEEVQSDLHKDGRKNGYAAKPDKEKKDRKPTGKQEAEGQPERVGPAPQAPFKKTWPILATKRIVRFGAENGFDSIAWTPGEIQAERYKLSTQSPDGKGLKDFYDKILVNEVNNFFGKKKWGKPKVETVKVGENDLWLLPITQEMKDKALYEGMPLYSAGNAIDDMRATEEDVVQEQGLPIINYAKRRFGKNYKNEKDLLLIEELLDVPRTIGKRHPVIGRLVDITTKGSEQRTKMVYDYYSKGLAESQAAISKSKERYKELTDLIWAVEGNRFKKSDVPTDWYQKPEKGKSFKANEKHYEEVRAFLEKKKYNPDVVNAFIDIRKTLDQTRIDLGNLMMNTKDFDQNLIQQYRSNIGKIHNYFPHSREGNSFVQVIDSKGNVAYREHYFTFPDRLKAENNKAYARAERWIKKEGLKDAKIKQGKVKQMPDELFENIPIEAMQQLVTESAKKVATSKDGLSKAEAQDFKDRMEKAISLATAEVFKSRGFGQHAIARKGTPGYIKDDPYRTLFDYLNGFSGFKTKMERSREYSTELFGIEAKKTPGTYRYASKYVKDMLANQDSVDRGVDRIRALFFMKYLGFVVKSGMVNLTQNVVMAAPMLSKHTTGMLKAERLLSKAMLDTRKALASKEAVKGKEITYKNLNPEELRAIQDMHQKGVTIDQYLRELKGRMPGRKWGKLWNIALENAGFFMRIAERFNRESTGLAAFRLAYYEGVKGQPETKGDYDASVKFASGIVYDSHFLYGKANLPVAVRGGTVQKYAKSMYTFRQFGHNYLSTMFNEVIQNPVQGSFMLAKSMIGLSLVGGLSSWPFFEMISSLFFDEDEDPMTEIRSKIPSKKLKDVVTYGLPGAAGFDITGSLGMSLPQNFFDILGVPYAMVEDTNNMMMSIKSGDYYRSVAETPITPMVIRNAMRGNELYEKGQKTRSGRMITEPGTATPKKLTGVEAVGKGIFGLQPTSMSKGYAAYRATKKATESMSEKKRYLANRYANAIRREDKKEIAKIKAEIKAWNAKAKKENKPYRVIDIRGMLKSRLKTRGSMAPKIMRRREKEITTQWTE